ncbi:MAG TPA: hypothetical protein VFP23_07490 [Solirubrobacterales bacterium]|nr:hypothetical protein [Solirubrobacterales bacterium]
MISIHFVLLFAAGALAFWLLGGVLCRLGGLLCVAAGALGMAFSPGAEALLFLALGTAIWLAGHWHYALRRQRFKNPLTRYVFCRWAPAWLDPTRSWAVAVVPERSESQPRRRRRAR